MTIFRLLELLVDNVRSFRICFDHLTGFVCLTDKRNRTVFEGALNDINENIVETEILPMLLEVD